jgi:hypothetical protein
MYTIYFYIDMDYIPPPDGPLPEAESLLDDSEDDASSGAEFSCGGGVEQLANGNGGSGGGALYSRLRLILQTPDPAQETTKA